ncbi:MAG: TauD/TfdA dioxygenase family protein [Hyphomicrobiaceae bacterium]
MTRCQTITLTPLGDGFGAEIGNVDLSADISEDTFSEIEDAFASWSVVVFRNQNLTPARHLAFAQRFGELEINAFSKFALDGHPGILKLSNIIENGELLGYADAGSFWHSDMSYTQSPPRLTMLFAIEIPFDEDGNSRGDTMFANAVAAYEALDRQTKSLIDGRKAVHFFGAKKRGVKTPVTLTQEQIDKNPPVSHPIARTHPVTGRKAIYVTADECTGIEGMADEDALPLLQQLSEHVVKPEFQYHHKWQGGDVLMWDNCAVQHVVNRDYEFPRDRRYLHRVTVNGSVPF